MKGTPSPDEPGYADKIMRFVQEQSADTFEGQAVHFGQTFASTVSAQDAFPTGQGEPALLPLMNLEVWGAPTSKPARDPRNQNFIYQRFQRGIMHYDSGCSCTQGLLLADYFKALLVGQNVPADLAAQARESRFFKQYDPAKPNSVARPTDLPHTDLSQAFNKQAALAQAQTAALQPAPPPAPIWMKISQPTLLWSGPDARAIQLGSGAAGDYYQVNRATAGQPGARDRRPHERASLGRHCPTEAFGAAPSGLAAAATSATSRVGGHPHRRRPVGRRRRQAPAGAGAGRERVQTTRGPAGVAAHVQDPVTGGSAWLDAAQVGSGWCTPGPIGAEPLVGQGYRRRGEPARDAEHERVISGCLAGWQSGRGERLGGW